MTMKRLFLMILTDTDNRCSIKTRGFNLLKDSEIMTKMKNLREISFKMQTDTKTSIVYTMQNSRQ
jgi:hypothetical protein